MQLAIRLLILLLALPTVGAAETIIIEAARDATLIEEPEGDLANGSGPVFFVGRTSQRQNSVRRGLLFFDVAAALPRNAWIERAQLTLTMTPSNPQPVRIALHRLLADWGEGPSFATGGGGAYSAPGDATWIHTFFDDVFWHKPGGHFVARASAAREVAAAGDYTWESTPKLLADLKLWLRAPQRNFGWILLGDETTPQNSKSFASWEELDAALRPVLEVYYRLPDR